MEGVEELAHRAIEQKVFPGCVIGIVRGDGEREVLPFGRLTYEKGSPEVRKDTLYDLASITKSIPVASLVALFAADRRLNLQDKVTKFIPELENDFGATIEDLLRYRVHGERMSSLNYPTFEQLRTHIFEHGFDGPPGESEYTNLPAFLLGITLERVGGEILPALAHKYFFGPLDMNDTTFFPSTGRLSLPEIAPTEIVEGVEIRGIVHDESARIFARKRRAVGHAGLFSTTPDLLKFLEPLLLYRGEPSVSVADAAQQGLGWQTEGSFLGHLEQESSEQGLASLKKPRFGRTGFTGTSVVVHREKGIGLVILSNRTYPGRPADPSAVNSFRADIADIIFS